MQSCLKKFETGVKHCSPSLNHNSDVVSKKVQIEFFLSWYHHSTVMMFLINFFLSFLSVFHMAPPSSPTYLPGHPCSPTPPQLSPTSLTSSRLQNKHQKLRESRRLSGLLTSLPPLPHSTYSSSSPDAHPFRCRNNDFDKPKGKRPCKTKHTGEEMPVDQERDEGVSDDENTGKVS